MPSRRLQLDGLDWKFLLARSAFLLLGTLATILLTVWVPALEELDSRWSPLLVMGITGAAEFINRWLKDNRTFYSTLLFVVAALFVAGGDAAAQSFSGIPLTPTLTPTNPVERGQEGLPLFSAKPVESDGLNWSQQADQKF